MLYRFLCICLLMAYTHQVKAEEAIEHGGLKLHGATVHGNLSLPKDFSYFPYVNPNAPKGGRLVLEGVGGFDNFNPYTPKGDSPSGINLIFDRLLNNYADASSEYYAGLASWVSISEDGLSIRFKINDAAKFHDGSPVLASDVQWSFHQLIEFGNPLYRFYYGDVERASLEQDNIIYFKLKQRNPEMAMILGQLTVLSQKDWQDRDYSKTTLTPYVTSGPYRIKRFEAGKFIEYERVKDYWGENIPSNIGQYNFDLIRYDFYKDRTISREAFKAGKLDIWSENSAKSWASAFDVDAVEDGRILLKEFFHERVAPMQGFAFNIRKPIFADIQVREALSYAWDFEWVNKTIMFNAYQRTRSFFDNSEMAATGLPNAEEMAILEPFKDQLPERVFSQSYQSPTSDGSGQNRQNLRIAVKLLGAAGWKMQEGILTHQASGEKLEFELLLASDSLEAHSQAFVRGVERLGGKVHLRIIDAAQYTQRVRNHDFDMIVQTIAQSDSPGNEQREYWGSKAADTQGSRNIFGFKNEAADKIIESLIIAQDRQSLVNHVRALDRILQWHFIIIPQYYGNKDRYAWWDKLSFPEKTPKNGINIMSWWAK